MRILIYHWKAYSSRFLFYHLQALGHEVNEWSNDKIVEDKEDALQEVSNELKKGYDLVFSYNYFRIIAMVCHEKNIPYFVWTQDSPMLSLYDNSTYLDTNYFFCFDYEQYEGMKKRGILNAFYCPLAVDTKRLREAAFELSDKGKNYGAEISFVGSLYSNKNMLSTLHGMPEYIKGYFDGFVETQLRLPALRFSQAQIPADVMRIIQEILVFSQTDTSKIKYEELVENLIDRQVTVVERRRMIDLLSGEKGFKLYTNSDTSEYPKVNNCGTVDYYTEMPKVFRQTKINLNVSLRSIRSGIPLRILDVIACGGFLLTNAQPELFWFFEEGESIATFQNLEEMEEKISYYLQHEAEREKIIQNSRIIVEEKFDFAKRLPEMFKMAGF